MKSKLFYFKIGSLLYVCTVGVVHEQRRENKPRQKPQSKVDQFDEKFKFEVHTVSPPVDVARGWSPIRVLVLPDQSQSLWPPI